MAITTFLANKKRKKSEFIFGVLGALDEVNAALGFVKVVSNKKQKELLNKVQKDILTISSEVAGRSKSGMGGSLVWLEKQIEGQEKVKKIPDKFVLPGENELESRIHLARTTVRRAERKLIVLSEKKKIPDNVLNYLNRLSWFLFLLAID